MLQNKEIATLHFITSDNDYVTHSEQAIRAYSAGCKWVQLRMKDVSEEVICNEVMKILPVANAHNGILLINDNPSIALKTNAHGVHLGKNDMLPIDARKMLGNNFIIGGTANTFHDIVHLIEAGVDYVGLGPFRFTTTKKILSPILGLDGYKNILSALKQEHLHIPIIAIGGIIESDINSLQQTNIHGIALSGAILVNTNIEINIKHYQELINSKI